MASFLSMNTPLGRPNCFHVSSSLPSWSKMSMRLLDLSATNSRPRESIAMLCGWFISPGPEPCVVPHDLMNVPSFENFTTRPLAFATCPSVTKTSPFGATTTSLGPANDAFVSSATPALPSVISTLPSGLNMQTCPPLPSLVCESVTHTLPSRSIDMPCGCTNMSAPKLLIRTPAWLNSRIGGWLRWNTQMLPLASGSTEITPPSVMLGGSCGQPGASLYGLSWADAVSPARSSATRRENTRDIAASDRSGPAEAGHYF